MLTEKCSVTDAEWEERPKIRQLEMQAWFFRKEENWMIAWARLFPAVVSWTTDVGGMGSHGVLQDVKQGQ